MNFLANLIASVLHPLVIVIPGVYLIAYQSTGNSSAALYWTLLSILFSSLIACFVAYGVKKGFFNNLDVSNRKQRIILYPFAIAVVCAFAIFVYSQNGPFALIYASVSFILALIILDLINRKIKASIHTAAVASIVTVVIVVYGGVSVLLLLLIPLIAWARITQKRHTLRETIVGGIAGVVLTVIPLYIVQFIVK